MSVNYLKARGPVQEADLEGGCINAILVFLEDCAAVSSIFDYDVTEHKVLLAGLISRQRVPASIMAVANDLMGALSLKQRRYNERDVAREQAHAALMAIQGLRRELSYPLHVYHGTTAGKLKAIMGEGLVPGSRSPWRNVGEDVKRQCNKYTFFTVPWTAAINFALLAYCRSRGPRSGWARSPVVLRFSTDGLALERDPLASEPNCLRVLGRVSAAGTAVRLSPFTGVSKWVPIEAACRKPGPQQ